MLWEPTQSEEDIFGLNSLISMMMIEREIVVLFRNEQV